MNGESTSSFALQRREKSFCPHRIGRTYTAGDTIEVDVDDNNAFLDLQNSYFRMNVAFTNSDGFVGDGAFLERNGIHALFSQWNVFSNSTRQVLNREKNYNTRTAQTFPLLYDDVSIRQSRGQELCGLGDVRCYDSEDRAGPEVSESIAASEELFLFNQHAFFSDGGFTETDATEVARFTVTSVSVSGNLWEFGTTVHDTSTIGVDALVGQRCCFISGANRRVVNDSELLVDSNTSGGALISGTGDNANLVEVGDVFVLALSVPERDTPFSEGDQVTIPGLTQFFTVLYGTHEYFEYFSSPSLNPADPNAIALGTELFLLKGAGAYANPRFVAASEPSTTVTVCFQPDMGFFNTQRWFPLFLLGKGLHFEGVLDKNLGAKAFWNILDSSLTHQVSISDIEFVAVLYNTTPIINQEYMNLYERRGLFFPFVEHENYTQSVGAANPTQMITIPAKFRSVHHVLARAVTTEIYQGGGALNALNPSLSSAFNYGISSYKFRFNQFEYPESAVPLGGADHENLIRLLAYYRQNQKCGIDQRGYRMAMPQNFLGEERAHSKGRVNGFEFFESDRQLMFAILARDDCGVFAGQDTMLEQILLELTFSSSLSTDLGSNRLVQSFVGHDVFTHISKDGITRLS